MQHAESRTKGTPAGAPGALVLALATLACSPTAPPADDAHQVTVTDEDGVTVVRTTGGPKYDQDLFTYELVTEVRPDPEVEESILYRPFDTDVDGEGFLYVADSGNHRIAVFDPDGDFVRAIGREGEGPGEFQMPVRVEIVDGLVHVPDSRRRGTHTFEKDGTFVRFVPWPRFERVGSFVPERWMLPDGRQVVRHIAEERENDFPQRVEIAVFDEAGQETARVTSPWVRTGERHMVQIDGRQAGVYVPAHYHAQVWGGWAPGAGIYLSTGEEPTIRWYSLAGEPTARWEIDLPAREITAADREAAEAQARENLEGRGGPAPAGGAAPSGERPPSPMARVRADNIIYADHKPYWGTVEVDDRGHVWLSRPIGGMANPGSDDDLPRYRVLSPEGEYLGFTDPPGPGEPSGGLFPSRRVDEETGEPVLVVYRMVPAVEGFEYR